MSTAPKPKSKTGKRILIAVVIVAVIVIGYLVYKKMKEKADLAKLMEDTPTPDRDPGTGSGGSGSGGSGSGGGSGGGSPKPKPKPAVRANSAFPYVPKANEFPMQMNSRGPGVKQLQKALGVTETGKWDVATETAAIDATKARFPGQPIPKPFKIVNSTLYDEALRWLEFH